MLDRRAWAATVAWSVGAGRLDDDEASTIATTIAWAVQIEPTDARTALLTALQVIADRDRVPPWALDQVLTHLPVAELAETERSLRASLATAIVEHRRRVGGSPTDGL